MSVSSDSLTICAQALADNGFAVFPVADAEEARALFFTRILPSLDVRVVSWGDSLTMEATGVLPELCADPRFEVIDTFERGVPREQIMQRRRRALLSDLFLTGSNAVTRDGRIVNLDMIGNRTAPISFGPKEVVLFVGRNKIVADLEGAMDRIKTIAAPRNARRHGLATPCATSGTCHDCSAPQRICNTWSILDKCFPKQRIKVILIDDRLGL